MPTEMVTTPETINEAIRAHLIAIIPEATPENVFLSDDPLFSTQRAGTRHWYVVVPPTQFQFDEASFIGGGDGNTEVMTTFDVAMHYRPAGDRPDQVLQRQTSFNDPHGIHWHTRRLLKAFSSHYLLSNTITGSPLINEFMRPGALAQILNDRQHVVWQLSVEIRFSFDLDD